MDIRFNLAQIKQKFLKNFSVILWLFVIIVLGIEATVVRESVVIFTELQRISDTLQGKNLRIDFDNYKGLEKRLEDNIVYKPEPFIYISPFGVVLPENIKPDTSSEENSTDVNGEDSAPVDSTAPEVLNETLPEAPAPITNN